MSIQTEIDKHYKHNFRVNFLDGAFFWFGGSFIATRTIFPLYLSYLTDSTLAFSILATIASTGWLLPQLFTSNWVQQLPIKKVVPVNYGFLLERVPILMLVLAAWAATRSYELALVLSLLFLAWHVVGAGVIAVGWQDMIAKIFSTERRGRFFGVTNATGMGMGVAGASLAAVLLDKFSFPYNFMICFGIAAAMIFLSWIFLAMTREPAETPNREPLPNHQYFRSLPKIIKTDANYRKFLISQVVLAVGSMSLGFFTIYTIKQWDIPDSHVGFYTTSMLVGQAVSNLFFGWLADRSGHKVTLAIAALAGALAPALAFIAPDPNYFFAVFALQGISNAGFILSGIMIVFEFCEPAIRPTYIGMTNTIIGIFSGTSPLIGGIIVEHLGYQPLFLVSLLVSLAGLVVLVFFVKEPRYATNHLTAGDG